MKTISTLLQAKKAAPGVYNVKDAEGVGFKKEGAVYGSGGFTFRYRLGDRRPTMGLGSPGDFNDIEEVKAAADVARKLARKGIDPIVEREREKEAVRAHNLDLISVDGDNAKIETIKDGFDGPVSLVQVGDTIYVLDAPLRYLLGPEAKEKKPPPPFKATAVPAPKQ